MELKAYWVAINQSGGYASKDCKINDIRITFDVNSAITFNSHSGCELWCKASSDLNTKFIPNRCPMIKVKRKMLETV